MIPYIKICLSLVEPIRSEDPPIDIVDVFRYRTTGALEIADQEENAARLADQAIRELFAKLREKINEASPSSSS